MEGAQGILSPAVRLYVSRITPEFAYLSVPKLASADDRLQAAALIWAPRNADFNGPCPVPFKNDFHLAHEMPS